MTIIDYKKQNRRQFLKSVGLLSLAFYLPKDAIAQTLYRRILIDKKKCTGCKECIDVCPVEVFEMKGDMPAPIKIDECMGCRSCVEVCEDDAIMLKIIFSYEFAK